MNRSPLPTLPATSPARLRLRLGAGLAAPALVLTGLVAGLGTAPALAAAPASPPSAAAADPVVVRLSPDAPSSCTIRTVAARHDLDVEGAVVRSRRVFRVASGDPSLGSGARGAARLARQLRQDRCLTFAEADSTITLADDQFHSWTGNGPSPARRSEWQRQPATSALGLAEAHRRSRGVGALVAVLDTGVDATHEGLAGRLRSGYDYVDDDADPDDSTCGCDTDGDGHDDGAVGHGTFVAGTVALVAPEARILPMRVLDSDGEGTVFAVTAAILDAVDADADVINLSFGTDDDERSRLLEEAIRTAEAHGVLVVAAAGNGGRRNEHYPANLPTVLSVGSTDAANAGLARFSNYGRWVDVAAVGEDVVGLSPGGRYVRWSGTSISTPVVAGQLALLSSASPRASATRLRSAVTSTTRSLSTGRIQFGRVDLPASLSEIARSSRPGRNRR